MAEHEGQTTARLSAQDAALLSEQIAGLTRAGLPLASGLEALGAELPHGRLQRALGTLARKLGQGASLDEAIAAQGHALPAHLKGLVLAGERTGRLGEVLGRFAGYARIGTEVRRHLWLNLVYPAASTLFAIALLLFILLIDFSGFDQIFMDYGLALPLLSQWLISLSRGLRTEGLLLIEALGVLALSSTLVLALAGPAARRSVLAQVPLLGPVWRWTSLAEFLHLLALLIESEVPMAEAVPMAGEGVVDSTLRHLTRGMKQELQRGAPLYEAMNRRMYFPEGVGCIVRWAEQHQCLAEALHMLGEMFEARARAQATFASAVCTVMTVLMILLGVGLVICGAFLPMIQLIQKLSG